MTEHASANTQHALRNTADAALAVVIVSYNVRDLLAACLKATLESLTQSGYEMGAGGRGLGAGDQETTVGGRRSAVVVVVDNASADGSAEMVAARFPQVCLVASRENLGFAGGNNLALRMLGLGEGERGRAGEWENGRMGERENGSQTDERAGDFGPFVPPLPHSPTPLFSKLPTPSHVLLLNPDAEPLGDAIGQMAGFLEAHPHVGGVGARLQYADGRFQHGVFRFPDLWQLWFDFFPPRPRRLLDSRLNGRYPRAWFDAGRPFPVDFALGAALMVRSEAIGAAGLLDESYFMYAEEVDWCWRIQRAGWPFYCVPAARVIHHGGASTQQFRAQSFLNLWRSRKQLYGRFYGPGRRWLVGWIVRLGMWAEARRLAAAVKRGEITCDDFAARWRAIQEVRTLFGAPEISTG